MITQLLCKGDVFMVCKIDMCDCNVIHKEVVETVKKQMPKERQVEVISNFYKIFSDVTKLKILWALNIAEMCVCDIAVLINVTKSAISHQLRVLKQAKLVKFRKEGKIVYYSLDDEHVSEMYEMAKRHIEESYSHK